MKTPKPIPLVIYEEKGTWWMEFGGDPTDDLIHSKNGEWVAGFFAATHGARCVLTDRTGVAVVYLLNHVEHRVIHSRGILAVLEWGSLKNARLNVMRGDGMAGVFTKLKQSNQIERLSFMNDGAKLVVHRHDGEEEIDLTTVNWRSIGRVIRYPKNGNNPMRFNGPVGAAIIIGIILIVSWLAA